MPLVKILKSANNAQFPVWVFIKADQIGNLKLKGIIKNDPEPSLGLKFGDHIFFRSKDIQQPTEADIALHQKHLAHTQDILKNAGTPHVSDLVSCDKSQPAESL